MLAWQKLVIWGALHFAVADDPMLLLSRSRQVVNGHVVVAEARPLRVPPVFSALDEVVHVEVVLRIQSSSGVLQHMYPARGDQWVVVWLSHLDQEGSQAETHHEWDAFRPVGGAGELWESRTVAWVSTAGMSEGMHVIEVHVDASNLALQGHAPLELGDLDVITLSTNVRFLSVGGEDEGAAEVCPRPGDQRGYAVGHHSVSPPGAALRAWLDCVRVWGTVPVLSGEEYWFGVFGASKARCQAWKSGAKWGAAPIAARCGERGQVHASSIERAWNHTARRVGQTRGAAAGVATGWGAATSWEGTAREAFLSSMIATFAPGSIVQVASAGQSELDSALRAVVCNIGEIHLLQPRGTIFLNGIELHTWNCDSQDKAFRQVLKARMEWAGEVPRLPSSATLVAERGGVEMLLLDVAQQSYNETLALVQHWSPLLTRRAAIHVRGCHALSPARAEPPPSPSSPPESCDALRFFAGIASRAAASGEEGGEWSVFSYRGEGGEEGSGALLVRDPDALAGEGARVEARCWGCARAVPSVGDKWDVPGVYINIDGARRERMESLIRALQPKAAITRFEGRDGSREDICLRIGTTFAQTYTVCPKTVCCLLSHWLAIHSFFQNHPEEDYFVVLEDDVSFDLVEFWPGSLSEYLKVADQLYPGWQTINLASSNWRNATAWRHRQYFAEYEFSAFSAEAMMLGAIFYAVRRSDEMEELASAVAACLSAASLTSGCVTRLAQHADGALYDTPSLSLASSLPLLRIELGISSVRKKGRVDAAHMLNAKEHLEAWNYLAFLHYGVPCQASLNAT